MNIQGSEPLPIACSLGAGDLENRLAWIAALNEAALRHCRRDDLRLELTYAREALEQVREMIRREQDCCGFLRFAVHEEPEAVRVIIVAPEAARQDAESVFEPFLPKASVEPAVCGCTLNAEAKSPQARGYGPACQAPDWRTMMQGNDADTVTAQSRNRQDVAKSTLAAGGLLAAFGLASCCALPLLLGALGIGSASLFGMFGIALLVGPYQQLVLVVSVACLLGAVWIFRRQQMAWRCGAGRACERTTLDRASKLVVVLAIGLLALTFWIAPPL